MVGTILNGGIGNQLFIYAAAKALALKLNTDLVLNINTGFKDDHVFNRDFELSHFNIDYKSNRILSFDYKKGNIFRTISSKIGRNIFYPTCKYIKEPSENQYSDVLSKCNNLNVFIQGYWQSEKYFKEYEQEIRNSLIFDTRVVHDMEHRCASIFNGSGVPVCVGVRRYQECPDPSKMSVAGKDYYIKSMNYISMHIKNPVFYIFTQDKIWAKENFQDCGFNTIVVEYDQCTTISDLYLMSKFQYHIISNSSYYWWGAWLANGKIVIAPDNFVNKDSICENWTILENN